MDTSHLAGLFISIPAVSQQELSGGQGGCLDIWRFEGSMFQLYRTGLCAPRYRWAVIQLTARVKMNRNELHIACTDAFFANSGGRRQLFLRRREHPSRAICPRGACRWGRQSSISLCPLRFQIQLLHCECANFIPASHVGAVLRVYTGTGDLSRAHFGQQVYTAAVRPGQPSGLDLSWMESDTDTGSNGIDGGDVTHLLPASLPKATESKLMQDEGSPRSQPGNSDQPLASDSWCGELEVFASVCQVCLQRETVMLHTAASAASSEPAGRMDLYFWRMNTWACQVGVETAPDMPLPSDFHVRSDLTSDIETQRGAVSASRQLLQADDHRRAARRERASVHLREEEEDGEGGFVFDDANFPSNNAAWLLYAEPTRLLGNYTQGALAGDATDCWSPLEPLENALVGCMYLLARRDSKCHI
jgi:hypothetical protein